MKNFCPVCGYDFKEPIEDSMICDCCGTQYGYHDSVFSHAQLRDRWLTKGAKWHSRRILPPAGWSAANQLRNVPGTGGTSYVVLGVAGAADIFVGDSLMAVAQARSTDSPTVGGTVQRGKSFFQGTSLSAGPLVCPNF